ncbi:MAG: LPS export ABC transporter permease LptF [SAR324 cluster bacterium]|nr:LPS export ABC transporter permease LptF [SAR324 cluster bacterium]
MLARSLFLQLIPPFLLATFILTFILSMDTVYKLINLIVSRGVPVGSVLLMLLYRLPQFLSVTLPIAVVITVVVVLVRLSNDLELTAMGASGLSPWQLTVPVATFGLVTTILDLGITLWMQPAGYAAYEEETLRLLRSQTAKTIRPGVLNYDFPGKVLYVESKSPNEELEGIFISDTELRPSSMVSLSSKGQLLIREKEQDILLQLKQGTMHFGNAEGGYRTMDFEEFQYQFRPPQLDGSPNRKVWGVSTMDLIQADEYFGEQTRQRELQLRLTTPMACLAFALAALNIGMVDPRRGRSNAYLQALVLIVIHYILWSFSKELTIGKEPMKAVVLWIPPILIGLWGVYQIQLNHQNWRGPLMWCWDHLPFKNLSDSKT